MTIFDQLAREAANAGKIEMLEKLDEMLDRRLAKEEVALAEADFADIWSDGYIDGLEFAMSCIKDIKDELQASAQ